MMARDDGIQGLEMCPRLLLGDQLVCKERIKHYECKAKVKYRVVVSGRFVVNEWTSSLKRMWVIIQWMETIVRFVSSRAALRPMYIWKRTDARPILDRRQDS
jgi:hypothetical protein